MTDLNYPCSGHIQFRILSHLFQNALNFRNNFQSGIHISCAREHTETLFHWFNYVELLNVTVSTPLLGFNQFADVFPSLRKQLPSTGRK
jgi:hypothetical protein